jgi:hypothetical protein
MDSIQKNQLPPEGEHGFTVISSKSMVSKSGNHMFQFILEVYVGSKKYNIYEHIMKDEKWLWKLKRLCDSIGIQDKYNAGKLSPMDFLNESGKASFLHNNDKKYGWKAVVDSYVSKYAVKESTLDTKIIDDELPF